MNARVLAKTKPSPAPTPPVRSNRFQLRCACGGTLGPTGECERCRKKRELGMLQRKVPQPSALCHQHPEVPPIVHEVLRSPGEPLEVATRAFMEPRFGHDFGHVRVHTDARAAQSARAVSALAYTVGSQIVFDRSRYAPETPEGRRLLAHELVHVVQQGASGGAGARVDKAAPNAISPSRSPVHEKFEMEADFAAAHLTDSYDGRKVVEGPMIGLLHRGSPTPVIQRKERGESSRTKKTAQFSVKRDPARTGSYLIHFTHPKTREEAIRILFAAGSLPEGLQLEDAGETMLGWEWKLRSLSGEMGIATVQKLSEEFQKHLSVKMLQLTPEESTAHRAGYEAFMDSRPSYLGGQSVREAFQECRDHEVPAEITEDGKKAAEITGEVPAKPGPGCWGKRAGYFYYIGWQEGYGTRLQVKKAPTDQRISKDWEWWLNQGFSLNDTELHEIKLKNWILQQAVFSFGGALSATPGTMRRPRPHSSTLRKTAETGIKAIETYQAWTLALGEGITESALVIAGLLNVASSSFSMRTRQPINQRPRTTRQGEKKATQVLKSSTPPAAEKLPSHVPPAKSPPASAPSPPARPLAPSLPVVDPTTIPASWLSSPLSPSQGKIVYVYRGFARNVETHAGAVVREGEMGGVLSRRLDAAQDAVFNQVGRDPVLTGRQKGGVVEVQIPGDVWDELVTTNSISERGRYPGFSRQINSTEIRVNSAEAGRLINSLPKKVLSPDPFYDFRPGAARPSQPAEGAGSSSGGPGLPDAPAHPLAPMRSMMAGETPERGVPIESGTSTQGRIPPGGGGGGGYWW